MVVEDGLTEPLLEVFEYPDGEDDQEYVYPEIEVTPMEAFLPGQIESFIPAFAIGTAMILIVSIVESEHPLELVSIKVTIPLRPLPHEIVALFLLVEETVPPDAFHL